MGFEFFNPLPQAHVNAKKSAMKPQIFLDIHSDICGLVLPMAAVSSVIEEHDSWLNVEDNLQAVVSSSCIGRKLFGFAIQQVLGQMVANKMHEALGSLWKQKAICEKEVLACKRSLLQQLEAVQNIDSLPAKRQIVVQYRGVDTNVRISGLAEEFDMRAAAKIKSEAAAAGDLPAIFCENDLVVAAFVGTKGKIKQDLLKQCIEARNVANGELAGTDCKDGETIKALGQEKT